MSTYGEFILYYNENITMSKCIYCLFNLWPSVGFWILWRTSTVATIVSEGILIPCVNKVMVPVCYNLAINYGNKAQLPSNVERISRKLKKKKNNEIDKRNEIRFILFQQLFKFIQFQQLLFFLSTISSLFKITTASIARSKLSPRSSGAATSFDWCFF